MARVIAAIAALAALVLGGAAGINGLSPTSLIVLMTREDLG